MTYNVTSTKPSYGMWQYVDQIDVNMARKQNGKSKKAKIKEHNTFIQANYAVHTLTLHFKD